MATSGSSTVKPPAEDPLTVGTVKFRTVVSSVDPTWEFIRSEDIFVKKTLKTKVQKAINEAIEAILAGEESSEEDEDSNEGVKARKPATRRGCVRNMLFTLDTFDLLEERQWFPEVYESYRLIYELDRNHLIVSMASPAHDVASNSWNDTITVWHKNGGQGARTLVQTGQGRITRLQHVLIFPEFRWSACSKISPDQSFVPRGLSCPPAKMLPGTAAPYPNMVIEVSKTHESWNGLLHDAEVKHFSADTSVQVWIGVKLYDNYGGRFRCMFRLRDRVNNGVLAGSGASTDYLSINQPTDLEFIIPKAEIFWGVNPPLPPTFSVIPGPNALPPPQVPGVQTDDLVLALEDLRQDVKQYM